MAQNNVNAKLLVIGGSAGSLDGVLKIVAALPPGSGAVVVIVLHRKHDAASVLAHVLATRTQLQVKEVEDKEPVATNQIFVVPPNYHVLFEDENTFALDASEKIHHSRPSIDVTFESAAQVFKNRVIGVLLSGANADGAAGLKAIKEAGGLALVQNPATAEVGFMPQQAVLLGATDKVADAAELASYVAQLLRE